MRVGYEALAWGLHVNDYRDAWEIVRRADHKSIGIILDSFHALAPSFPTNAIQSIPADKIFLVQLADAPKLGLDVLSWSRHFRCFPGQGDLPVAGFMQAVLATGYSGPLSLEIFNDQFRAGSAARTATDGLRSLILLEDQLGKVGLASSSRSCRQGGKPRRRLRRVRRQRCQGQAISPRCSASSAFARPALIAARHVERWSQGHIDLVINCEPDGFAHSHYLTHGPGVCAIAIDVDDAGKTMARAEALKARTFYQPVGPGELEIPAIRGVGGSLLYFLEGTGKNWDLDFETLRSDASTDRLDAVDHISQSMPYDEMLSWLLFYTGILDLKRLPQMEIADPVGLVQSQALINADQSLRVVLNGSSATRTLSARFIHEFFGSGVQHIAFSCNDIFATVAAMRASGRGLPENPRQLLRRHRSQIRPRRRDHGGAARTTRSCTTAKATANSSRSTPTSSTSGSSSRSWSAATITASAPPMPRSGWRRRPANRARSPCREAKRARRQTETSGRNIDVDQEERLDLAAACRLRLCHARAGRAAGVRRRHQDGVPSRRQHLRRRGPAGEEGRGAAGARRADARSPRRPICAW